MPLVIGITNTASRYSNYPEWIGSGDPDITTLCLAAGDTASIDRCDGIVLSGGIDTHPRFYGSDELSYPHAPDQFDEGRDEFELGVLRFALNKRLPVLAICRGMQLVNIALGGDLIQDVEAAGKHDHRRHGETDGMHEVQIVKNSLLHRITGQETGVVNSAHHQALGNVAAPLTISAVSPDGIAEAAEWKEKEGKSFLLCVQWHPERLGRLQPENPCSKNIRTAFLEAAGNNPLLYAHH